MKKTLTLITLILIVHANCIAQSSGSSYNTAIGARTNPLGFSIKSFGKNNAAIEGICYFWKYGTTVIGLYEIHKDISDIDGLQWYYGGGGHVSFFNDKWKTSYPAITSKIGIGIDGVIGLDYKFGNAPINLSIDWQPSFNVTSSSYFEGSWGGLAVRYAF